MGVPTGVPNNRWFSSGKIPSFEMDDWGYPHDLGPPQMEVLRVEIWGYHNLQVPQLGVAQMNGHGKSVNDMDDLGVSPF